MSGAPSRSRIAVLGAGPLGTLAARQAAASGRGVTLWAREVDAARTAARRRTRPGPELPLPREVRVTSDPREALEGAGLVLLALSAGEVPELAAALGEALTADRLVVHTAKGLDGASGRRPSEVIAAECSARRLGALGGPYLLSEMQAGYAVTLVSASRFDEVHRALAETLASERVHIRPTHDLVGVEIAGAAVVSLGPAAGLCAGLQLDAGARAVLLARALAEAGRLGEALGADPATFSGPAGVADLLVVSGDPEGLGFRFGRRVGAGEPLAQVQADAGERLAALRTLDGFRVLAERARVRLPAFRMLRAVLCEGAEPRSSLETLLRTPD